MKILAVEVENKSALPEHFKPHFKNEAQRVWDLYKSGIIREIYFTEEGHNAVIILECGSGREAKEYLNSLPLVKENLISFNIMPLVPYEGFERLFG